ncbi:HNH endonuclease [Planococcus ruber]|uniref:HNH endonuclease n=1 Tax=Planococcus ruber TaxID=2027871 RepID=UPI001FEE2E94|nr:HNH endonuclease [Planococcus ruber]MCJ1908944.1 HNH endonuclease [Planococcus ruber]
MNAYIVMQGETYQEEKNAGLLWAPETDKAGMVPHSYQRLMEVKKGDRIFHYVKGAIVAISVAKDTFKKERKPYEEGMLENESAAGYLVPVEYRELENPLLVKDCLVDILPLLPVKYAAFKEDGTGNPGYLYPCNEELAIELLEGISRLNVYVPEAEQLELAMEVVRMTEHNPLITLIAETIMEMKTKIQRGQLQFRKSLLPLWHKECPLCGMDIDAALKAGYAKPWKDSTDAEKINPFNGLLLCSNHEAMFTAGFISFTAGGTLHIAQQIPEERYAEYGLKKGKKISVYPENGEFFRWHKRKIFIDKRKSANAEAVEETREGE